MKSSLLSIKTTPSYLDVPRSRDKPPSPQEGSSPQSGASPQLASPGDSKKITRKPSFNQVMEKFIRTPSRRATYDSRPAVPATGSTYLEVPSRDEPVSPQSFSSPLTDSPAGKSVARKSSFSQLMEKMSGKPVRRATSDAMPSGPAVEKDHLDASRRRDESARSQASALVLAASPTAAHGTGTSTSLLKPVRKMNKFFSRFPGKSSASSTGAGQMNLRRSVSLPDFANNPGSLSTAPDPAGAGIGPDGNPPQPAADAGKDNPSRLEREKFFDARLPGLQSTATDSTLPLPRNPRRSQSFTEGASRLSRGSVANQENIGKVRIALSTNSERDTVIREDYVGFAKSRLCFPAVSSCIVISGTSDGGLSGIHITTGSRTTDSKVNLLLSALKKEGGDTSREFYVLGNFELFSSACPATSFNSREKIAEGLQHLVSPDAAIHFVDTSRYGEVNIFVEKTESSVRLAYAPCTPLNQVRGFKYPEPSQQDAIEIPLEPAEGRGRKVVKQRSFMERLRDLSVGTTKPKP